MKTGQIKDWTPLNNSKTVPFQYFDAYTVFNDDDKARMSDTNKIIKAGSNLPYLIDDEVPPALGRHPQPLLETPSSLLDQNLPASGHVLLARFTVNLDHFKNN